MFMYLRICMRRVAELVTIHIYLLSSKQSYLKANLVTVLQLRAMSHDLDICLSAWWDSNFTLDLNKMILDDDDDLTLDSFLRWDIVEAANMMLIHQM